MSEDRVKRKLSAILSADVVGYSRLMQDDEVSTVRTLEAYRKVMSDLIEQFRGRVVDSPGDNLLSEFSSVVDAVQCAVEINEVIRAKNEELPEDRRMLFRIGVNLGDVIEEGDRIYGEGVNIAARLEGLAEAGGICISGSAHEQIKNKLALGYEYIGEHTVKNIAEPLKVYRVPMGPKAATPTEKEKTKLKSWKWTALGAAGAIIVITAALAIWNFHIRGPSTESVSIEPEQTSPVPDIMESPKTVAVLPFVNLSSDPEQEYFVDGLSEEILNSLAQIPNLNVTGRTSSFSFKGTNKKTQEIADELGVENILEGSVRKAGNALRITAQLLKAEDGFHLWSKTYDKELKDVTDILAIQEDIATAVANELKLTLGVIESFKQLGRTDNLIAYEQYLFAIGLIFNLDYSKALESLNKAIELDPEFAEAWAVKGLVHVVGAAAFMPANEISISLNEGLNATQRVIEMEPGFGGAYDVLGSALSSKGKFIEAESAYQKAIDLGNIPIIIENFGTKIIHYWSLGHFNKCSEIIENILRDDPLNPLIRAAYILNLGFLGNVEQAEKEYEHCKVLFDDPWLYGDFNIVWLRSDKKEALSIDDIPESLNLMSPIFTEARNYMKSPKEGLIELHRIYSGDVTQPSNIYRDIAFWAAYFGEPDFALDAMEKSFNLHTMNFYFIWSPAMRSVRQFPRFKEFVREIGLVDYWKEFGWPDFCHPVGDDDFVCD